MHGAGRKRASRPSADGDRFFFLLGAEHRNWREARSRKAGSRPRSASFPFIARWGGVSMDLNDPKILRQLKKNQRQTQAWKSAGPAAAHRNRPKRPTAGEQALTTVESGPLDSEDARRKQLAEQQRRQQILSRLGIRDEEELATVLWKSVERGDIEVFSACVMAGADVQRNYSTVNGKEGINATVLHVAARNNHTHIIPRLCDSFPRPVPFQTSAVCPTATGAG